MENSLDKSVLIHSQTVEDFMNAPFHNVLFAVKTIDFHGVRAINSQLCLFFTPIYSDLALILHLCTTKTTLSEY